MSHNLFF